MGYGALDVQQGMMSIVEDYSPFTGEQARFRKVRPPSWEVLR